MLDPLPLEDSALSCSFFHNLFFIVDCSLFPPVKTFFSFLFFLLYLREFYREGELPPVTILLSDVPPFFSFIFFFFFFLASPFKVNLASLVHHPTFFCCFLPATPIFFPLYIAPFRPTLLPWVFLLPSGSFLSTLDSLTTHNSRPPPP